MKKQLLAIITIATLSLFTNTLVHAQGGESTQHKTTTEKAKSTSNLEMFSSETGTLIEKTFITVGKAGSVEIEVVVLKDLLTDKAIKGLRISKKSTNTYADDYSNFLDEDEINGLMKSMEILQEEVITTSPNDYTEVVFSSRSGLKFGAYFQKDWKFFVKVDEYRSDSSAYFTAKVFIDFEAYVKQARGIIESY